MAASRLLLMSCSSETLPSNTALLVINLTLLANDVLLLKSGPVWVIGTRHHIRNRGRHCRHSERQRVRALRLRDIYVAVLNSVLGTAATNGSGQA